jgi:hypothetical protein
MKTSPPDSSSVWAERWLDQVADGTLTMSQRTLASIENKAGLKAVQKLARERGVHLVLLTDDKGTQLVAASTKPFKVLC